MTIETISIEQLKPAAYNPRTIKDEAFAGLQASIERNGLQTPLVWNRRTGNLVGGHQRLKALVAAGATEARVSVVDLSDEDEKTLNLILNSERARGRMVSAKLIPLLEELQALPEFSDMRLNVLLQEFQVNLLTDDFTPEAKAATEKKTGTGDVERQEDGSVYLRLHFNRDQGAMVEEKLGSHMKEIGASSMTEAVLDLLAAV